jgi:hypothetical protein
MIMADAVHLVLWHDKTGIEDGDDSHSGAYLSCLFDFYV